MNIKSFFVDALSSALDLGIATPDDVIRHVTSDVLSIHLPRPLWARLLTAALGAPKVDAQLVVETIGVPNLCEHIPSTIIWACIAEVGARALSGVPAQPVPRQAAVTPPPMKAAQPASLVTPPPPEVKREATPRSTPLPAAAPNIPKPTDALADVVAALEADERQPAPSPSGRARTPTGQRFRQNSTNISRLGSMGSRRPQVPVPATDESARATAAAPGAPKPAPRGALDADEYVVETDVKDDWKSSLAVEDEQLVDWQGSEETVATPEEFRKR